MPLGRVSCASAQAFTGGAGESFRVVTTPATRSIRRIVLLSVSQTKAVPAASETPSPIGLPNLDLRSGPSSRPGTPTQPAKISTLWFPWSVKLSTEIFQMQWFDASVARIRFL